MRLLILGLMLTLLSSCGSDPAPKRLRLEDYQILDLTYTFDEDTLYWPTEGGFGHERTAWGFTEGGYWYSSYRFAGSEHGGTHLDAPIHFAEGKWGVAEIPVKRLAGPGVVIDVSEKCQADPDYLLTLADIEAHERRHDLISEGTVVLIRTGWGRYWPDAEKYLGSDVPGDTSNLHFPGVSAEAAQGLVSRGVPLVGIDTASIDRGMSRDFRAHQVLSAAQVAVLENVAHLDKVPEFGATILALPMKIGNGSGAPCRIIALLHRSSN